MSKFYSAGQISANQHKTAEGFLLCVGVPIARTGELLYGEQELNGTIEAGADGFVRVSRTSADLFSPETMASFEGKPVTVDHPTDFVSPDNWRTVAVGHMQNIRPGSGEDADKLLADLLITDSMAIRAIEAGLREVSLGYEAEYEQTAPGLGKQSAIMGNHAALVKTGRNGPEVAVRDAAPITDEVPEMKTKDEAPKPTLKERFLAAIGKTVDEFPMEEEKEKAADAEVEAEAKVEDADPVGGALARIEALLTKLLGMEEAEAKSEDAAPAADKCEDAKPEDPAPHVVDTGDASRAEILAPGITLDANLIPNALTEFAKTSDGAAVLATLDGLDDRAKFIAAAEIVKRQRSAPAAAPTAQVVLDSLNRGAMTPEKLNQLNAVHYGNGAAK